MIAGPGFWRGAFLALWRAGTFSGTVLQLCRFVPEAKILMAVVNLSAAIATNTARVAEMPMTPAGHGTDDRALIRQIAIGDAKALERLFTRNQTRVFRYLMRIVRNEAIAEELLNEVFLGAWHGAGRYEGRSEPATWLLSIAHNKAVSALRKKREVSGYDEDTAAQIPDEDDTPEVVTQKVDKGAAIKAAMQALSAEHREILDLVYYQEQSVAEAAEILQIPEATVKTRMFYARKKLGEILKERGVDRGWP